MRRPFTFGWNWRESTPHMLLLATFLELRPVDEHPPLPAGFSWPALLQEPPEKAIERFLVQGALTKASLSEQLDYCLTVPQLEELLRRHESVSGRMRKQALITRLISKGYADVYEVLPDVELLRCSDSSRSLVEEWLANPATTTHFRDKKMVIIATAILVWLLTEAIVPEVIGSAVYDLLKQTDEPAARELKQYRPPVGRTKFTYVTSALKLEWCFVPAGHFWMGSDDSDPDADKDEKPRRRLYLPAYYLGKYPITNRQYQVFVQAQGHREPYHWQNGRIPSGKADHPVAYVSWSDAVAFCQWAARTSGVPIRLLTEAEWEKGARGEKGYRYPWGNTWRPECCNAESRVEDTTPVGKYPCGASLYGAHDMSGNVWEWTSSLHRPYPYQPDDGREDMEAEDLRVLRGGSFVAGTKWARAACRFHYHLDHWDDDGFRVGWSAPSSLL